MPVWMFSQFTFFLLEMFFWGLNIIVHLKAQRDDFSWYRTLTCVEHVKMLDLPACKLINKYNWTILKLRNDVFFQCTCLAILTLSGKTTLHHYTSSSVLIVNIPLGVVRSLSSQHIMILLYKSEIKIFDLSVHDQYFQFAVVQRCWFMVQASLCILCWQFKCSFLAAIICNYNRWTGTTNRTFCLLSDKNGGAAMKEIASI